MKDATYTIHVQEIGIIINEHLGKIEQLIMIGKLIINTIYILSFDRSR
jgi:hypothetical protein